MNSLPFCWEYILLWYILYYFEYILLWCKSNFTSESRFMKIEKNIKRCMIIRKRMSLLDRNVTLSHWVWWSLFPSNQRNVNIISLLFSFLLSLSFLLFFWLPCRLIFCFREINSVFLTLFFAVPWIFPPTFNDVNVCFRDQNDCKLVIRNVIFFRILLFKCLNH